MTRERVHTLSPASRWSSLALSAVNALVVSAVCVSLASCDRAGSSLTRDTADWTYVQEAWGGVQLVKAISFSEQAELTFRLGPDEATQLDSAICACGMTGQRDDYELSVTIERCLCRSDAPSPLMIEFHSLEPGSYSVVYDDPKAGNPHLGTFEVP